jgi:hypothetical protein
MSLQSNLSTLSIIFLLSLSGATKPCAASQDTIANANHLSAGVQAVYILFAEAYASKNDQEGARQRVHALPMFNHLSIPEIGETILYIQQLTSPGVHSPQHRRENIALLAANVWADIDYSMHRVVHSVMGTGDINIDHDRYNYIKAVVGRIRPAAVHAGQPGLNELQAALNILPER